ncbi:PepSY-associated TM helix domain-containing protein [Terasakiella pusilla]|uniref:PepSY-associated TM helix domain-containing protein n=1 Tax=Terasakiella pusilla TaxID=64973 RepID=UPI003AA800C5
MKYRSTIAKIHKWLGLFILVFLLIQTISGLILLFREEIIVYDQSDDQYENTISLGEALEALAPQSQVVRIDYDAAGDSPAIFRISRGEDIEFYTLAKGPGGSFEVAHSSRAKVLEQIFHFHHDILSGDIGRLILAACATGLIINLILGLILWWRRGIPLRKALAVKQSAPPQRYWFELHKASGAIFSVLLLLTAITGLGLALTPELRPSFSVSLPPVDPLPQTDRTSLDPSRLEAIARQAFPSQKLRDVRFTKTAFLPYRFLFKPSSDFKSRPPGQILLDPFTGATIWRSDQDESTAGATLAWLYPLHTKFGLGEIGRVILILSAVGYLLVLLSAFYLWSIRRSRKRT